MNFKCCAILKKSYFFRNLDHLDSWLQCESNDHDLSSSLSQSESGSVRSVFLDFLISLKLLTSLNQQNTFVLN
jgi:hypothetical protein